MKSLIGGLADGIQLGTLAGLVVAGLSFFVLEWRISR